MKIPSVYFAFPFSPGYVRYDEDLLRANGHMHPPYHLDFFYSTTSTLKMGIKEAISSDCFIDIHNISSDCMYLVDL